MFGTAVVKRSDLNRVIKVLVAALDSRVSGEEDSAMSGFGLGSLKMLKDGSAAGATDGGDEGTRRTVLRGHTVATSSSFSHDHTVTSTHFHTGVTSLCYTDTLLLPASTCMGCCVCGEMAERP